MSCRTRTHLICTLALALSLATLPGPPAAAQRGSDTEATWKWEGETLHLNNRSRQSLLVIEVLPGDKAGRHRYHKVSARSSFSCNAAGDLAVAVYSQTGPNEFGAIKGIFQCPGPKCQACLPPLVDRSIDVGKKPIPGSEPDLDDLPRPHDGHQFFPGSTDAGCTVTSPVLGLAREDGGVYGWCYCPNARPRDLPVSCDKVDELCP